MNTTITYKNKALKRLKTGLKTISFLFIPVLIILTSFWNCANIQKPTGGPKDTIPPKVVLETPKNLTTNFSESKIIIGFDEYVVLENQQKEISFSPDMPKPPRFVIRKKNLHIELPDSLEKETTYVLNFGKSIVDNNEKNPLVDYKYVFSTGDKIDSLNISGKVINALTNLPEKEISVILIPTEQDSIFGKQKANIFTITDTLGNFKISYLKENKYRIYALKESNNDRIYNSPTEGIAFLSDSIDLKKDTSQINLYLSVPYPTEFKVLERKIDNSGKIIVKFNQPLEDPSLKIIYPEKLDKNKFVHINSKKDSANIWIENLDFDSIRIAVYEKGEIEKESFLLRKSKSEKFNREMKFTDNIAKTNKVDRTKHLEFISTSPIKTIDKSKIEFKEDSLLITNYQLLKDTGDIFKFIFRFNWKEKKNYTLKMDTGALIGPFGELNSLISKTFTYDSNEKYGDIKLKFTIPDTTMNYIVQILNSTKDHVMQENILTYQSGIYDYEIDYKKYLEGKYFVRIIFDRNQNNKWDPGILTTKTQPEEGWLFEKTLIIRPNWEQEEIIKIPPPTIIN